MAPTENKAQELLPGPRKPRRNPAANVLRVREGLWSIGTPLEIPCAVPRSLSLAFDAMLRYEEGPRPPTPCVSPGSSPCSPCFPPLCFPPLCFPHSSAFRLHVVCPLPELAADFPGAGPLQPVVCSLPLPLPWVEPERALGCEQQAAAFPPSVLWLSLGCVPLHMPG